MATDPLQTRKPNPFARTFLVRTWRSPTLRWGRARGPAQRDWCPLEFKSASAVRWTPKSPCGRSLDPSLRHRLIVTFLLDIDTQTLVGRSEIHLPPASVLLQPSPSGPPPLHAQNMRTDSLLRPRPCASRFVSSPRGSIDVRLRRCSLGSSLHIFRLLHRRPVQVR